MRVETRKSSSSARFGWTWDSLSSRKTRTSHFGLAKRWTKVSCSCSENIPHVWALSHGSHAEQEKCGSQPHVQKCGFEPRVGCQLHRLHLQHLLLNDDERDACVDEQYSSCFAWVVGNPHHSRLARPWWENNNEIDLYHRVDRGSCRGSLERRWREPCLLNGRLSEPLESSEESPKRLESESP